MQILWLFLFIGVIQCDTSNVLQPEEFSYLTIPCAYEYLTMQELAVKSAYIASYESMTSKKIYMETGIKELDNGSKNTLNDQSQGNYEDVNGVQNMLSTLKRSQDEEAKAKVCSMIYMTLNYYKDEVDVKPTGVKLGDANDGLSAQSILCGQRCKSSNDKFITQVQTLKTKYSNSNSNGVYKDKVNAFLEVKKEIDETSSDIFSSLRNTFILGSGSDLCKEPPTVQTDLQGIYNTTSVAGFFNVKNDAVELFRLTVVHVNKIFKLAMTMVYVNSGAYTEQDKSLRMGLLTYLNVVRANADSMSHSLILHILCIQSCAEKTYGKDSKEYDDVMCTLFNRVNTKLLMIIKSTQVAYQRAIAISTDSSMSKTNYGTNCVCQIDNIYNAIIWKYSKISKFDLRVVNRHSSLYPSIEDCVPEGMYCLKANALLLQSIVYYLNFIFIRLNPVIESNKSWTYIQMSLKELEMSFMSLKYSATGNKLLGLVSATYVYISMKSSTNSQSIDVQQIMDIIGTDIISTLAGHSEDLISTFSIVDNYIDINNKNVTKSIPYTPADAQKKSSSNNNPESNTQNNNNDSLVSTTSTTQSGTADYVQPSGNIVFKNSETHVKITTTKQVSDNLIYFHQSVTTTVTTTIESISSHTEHEYGKLTLVVMQHSKKIFDTNYEYLNYLTEKSLGYITDTLCDNNEDFQKAIVCLHEDLEEKKACLLSFVETPIIRCNYLLTSTSVNEYTMIMQSTSYHAFIKNLFEFFEVNYDEIYNEEKNVETYIKNCKSIIIKVYDKVSLILGKTADDKYKNFLVYQLEETLKVFNKTCECFEIQVSETLSIVQKFGEESEKNYSDDCKSRMEAILAVYSTVFTSCYQYAQSATSVSVLVSDYDVLLTQTTVVRHTEVEITVSKNETIVVQ